MGNFWRVVGLAVLAGCSLETSFEPARQHQWHVAFDQENIEGNAGFIWTEGRGEFAAGISVTGDEPFALRPWHVHQGTCAEGGEIMGLPGEYQLLMIDQLGAAQADVVIDRSLNPNRTYYVDIHHSQEDYDTIVACADATALSEN